MGPVKLLLIGQNNHLMRDFAKCPKTFQVGRVQMIGLHNLLGEVRPCTQGIGPSCRKTAVGCEAVQKTSRTKPGDNQYYLDGLWLTAV